MAWIVPPEDLTPDQLRAIELPPNEHRVILGAPGSGKTLALLYRARHLCLEYGVPLDRFRVFIFTNVLKQYIRSGIRDLGLPEENVLTFDDWCMAYHRRYIRGPLPWDAENHRPNFAAVRQAVLEAHSSQPPLYDFALVDEGQDLERENFELFKKIAKHVTVCVDHKQQIYDRGSSNLDIVEALGLRRSSLALLDAFRCCPYIVQIAAEFVSDPIERAAFLNQVRTSQNELQTPLVYEAEDFHDERQRLIEIIRERQLVDHSMAILFHKKAQVWGFAQGLREAGLEVETWNRRDGNELDFGNGIPKVLTLHGAKGLTFDTVVMPRLVPATFRRVSDARVERLLYVGITRATKWVYLSSVDGEAIPHLDRLRLLAVEPTPPVTFQSWADMPATRSAQAGKPPSSDDDLLDLV